MDLKVIRRNSITKLKSIIDDDQMMRLRRTFVAHDADHEVRNFIKELQHDPDSPKLTQFYADIEQAGGEISFVEFTLVAPEWLMLAATMATQKEAIDEENNLMKKWEHKTYQFKSNIKTKLSDEQLVQIRKVFQKCDKKGKGFLETLQIKELGHSDDLEMKASHLMYCLDSEQTGRISFTSFLSGVPSWFSFNITATRPSVQRFQPASSPIGSVANSPSASPAISPLNASPISLTSSPTSTRKMSVSKDRRRFTSTPVIEKARKLFAEMERGNGQLACSDVKLMLQKLNQNVKIDEDELKEVLHELDNDKDGYLSFVEFVRGVEVMFDSEKEEERLSQSPSKLMKELQLAETELRKSGSKTDEERIRRKKEKIQKLKSKVSCLESENRSLQIQLQDFPRILEENEDLLKEIEAHKQAIANMYQEKLELGQALLRWKEQIDLSAEEKEQQEMLLKTFGLFQNKSC